MICLTFNHEQNVAVVITIENVTFVSFGGFVVSCRGLQLKHTNLFLVS